MAARKEIVKEFVAAGMAVTKALRIAEVPKSSYYYQPKGARKGKSVSTHTLIENKLVDNQVVVEEIKRILSKEFIDYGYARTAKALKKLGYQINKKKVYRLMKEDHLLFPKIKRRVSKRRFVEFTVPLATRPFEFIEADFKYIYIEGYKRHAYLLTFLDVFSRTALAWELNMTMKSNDAVSLMDKMIAQWNVNPKEISIRIRTDNGSQFIAETFRESLQQHAIEHEFTHPGTPEQNAHIESFHNTLDRLVCAQMSFDDFQDAEETLERFFHVYNNERIMESILYMAPLEFLETWTQGRIGYAEVKGKIKYFLREKPLKIKFKGSSSDTFMLQIKDKQLLKTSINSNPILSSL